MKILLTGSNGLLGQKLVKLIAAKQEHELMATARGENRLEERRGYQYQAMDISNGDAVDTVFDTFKPEVLIHTAAMTHVDQCELNQEECQLLNLTAVKHLIAACERHDCHFVHLSTDFIFDGSEGPLTEDAEPAPLSFYGETKWKAEQLLMASGLKHAILRTVLVYGVAENMSRSNIVLWAKGALEKGEVINVVDDQFRTPTLAEDLAQACYLAASQRAEGVYNISGPDYMSILELVQRVARFWQLDESLIKATDSTGLNQPAKRPPNTGFIIDKAVRELAYKPHAFEEGLALVAKQLEQT